MIKTAKPLRLCLLLILLSLPSLAVPSAEDARAVVDRVVKCSLVKGGKVQATAEWNAIRTHRALFDPEFFALLEWAYTPHPDADGRDFHLGVDPIWQIQDSGVQSLAIGSAKVEGQLQAVVVDYQAPSIRPSQPPTRYHNEWLIGESGGKPVLKDIRYSAKHSETTLQDSLAGDIKKAQANFKAP